MARGEAAMRMKSHKMMEEACDLMISEMTAEYATALSSLSPAAFV